MTSKLRTGKKGYRFYKKNKDMLYDKQGLDDMQTEMNEEGIEKMDDEWEKIDGGKGK